jgi:hypothetical protein
LSAPTWVRERGLRAPFPRLSTWLLALTLLLVACGGPEGSAAPVGSAADQPADTYDTASGDASSAPAVSSSDAEGAGDFSRLGGVNLEVADYRVEEALAAEGGDAVASMLRSLEIDPGEVELRLAVAPGGDPTISDWHLPTGSAAEILEAWAESAPGTWSSTTLAGLPALSGQGLDGSSAWAMATDGRFVYIRTDDPALAIEAAATIAP